MWCQSDAPWHNLQPHFMKTGHHSKVITEEQTNIQRASVVLWGCFYFWKVA